MPSRRCSALSSLCICSRSLRSSAPSGSSSSSTCGWLISARASATRWRWPPESCAGPPLADAGQLHQRQQLVGAPVRARRAPRRAPSARRRRCRGCSCAGTARSPGTRCSRRAHRAAAQRHVLAADQHAPAVGSVKPPIMRRQVVLPEPEGPSSVKNSPARRSSGSRGRRRAPAERRSAPPRTRTAAVMAAAMQVTRPEALAAGADGQPLAAAEHRDVVGHPAVVRHAGVVLALALRRPACARSRSCRTLSKPWRSQPSSPSSLLPLHAAGTAGTEPNQAARSPCSFGLSECSSHM